MMSFAFGMMKRVKINHRIQRNNIARNMYNVAKERYIITYLWGGVIGVTNIGYV